MKYIKIIGRRFLLVSRMNKCIGTMHRVPTTKFLGICVQKGLIFLWISVYFCGLFLGCSSKSPYQFEPQVVVFSLLIAGYSNSIVKLERSLRIDKKLPEEGLGINDAEIVVSTSEDTIEYAPIEDKSGFFSPLDSLMVCPLETYHLKILVPDEDEIYSETIVPDTFRIVQPRRGDTLYKREYPPLMIWTKSQDAVSYFIDISSSIDTTHFSVNIGGADTVFPILSFFLGDTGKYVIRVAAIDKNYSDYLGEGSGPRERNNPREENTSCIQGGIGVFGSCAVESVQVYVK